LSNFLSWFLVKCSSTVVRQEELINQFSENVRTILLPEYRKAHENNADNNKPIN
jgi:hypothetical protein